MSSLNGLAYNDLISIRDLLQRAKTKTRQKTYRTHHLEASATTSQTLGQPPKQPELNDGSLAAPIAPIAISSLRDQHDHETVVGPPIEEQLSPRRSRSPRVNQTYSKEKTPHSQYLLIKKPWQACARKKPCPRTHRLGKRSTEQESGDNDDEHVVREEGIRPELGNPGRASTAPEEGLAVLKSIEKPRSSQSPSKMRKTRCLRRRTQIWGQHRVPKANEARKRKPSGRLRQGLKKTMVQDIDLKDFKFPPRPQTPEIIDFATWTPGSGFDGIHPSTTSTVMQITRGRQRVRSTRGELQPAARHAFKTVEIRDSEGSTQRRLFDVGNLHGGHHLLNDTRLVVVGGVTAEEAKTSKEHHPLHVTSSNEDRQTYEVGHLYSKSQKRDIGRALAEALDKTRSSREGTPRTTVPPLPTTAPSDPYPVLLSDSAAADVEAGDTEKTAHMDLLNAPPDSFHYGHPHPPSTVLSRLPTNDTKPSCAPRPSSHRDLQIPYPYQPYPYPPSSAPLRVVPHYSEEESEGQDEDEASEVTYTDPGSGQLDLEDTLFEEADEGQSTYFEKVEDAGPTEAHNSHINSPPQSTSSSEAMLEENWHGIPSSPAHPLRAPILTTGGYFATAIERLSSTSKPAQILPPRKSRATTPSIPRGGGLRMRGGEADLEGELQLGISPSLKQGIAKGAFKPPMKMETEIMRREMGYGLHWELI